MKKNDMSGDEVDGMCAHYTVFSKEDIQEIQNIVRIVEKKLGKQQPADVWPGYTAPVLVLNAERKLTVQPMVWGFPERYIKKDGTEGAIQYRQNAKFENAHRLKLWRDSYEHRRCLIPAAAFDENKKLEDGSNKLVTFSEPGKMLYIAGFYKEQDGKRYYTMLTTEPNSTVIKIHNRMPLVLARHELGQWLYGNYDELGDREHLQLREHKAG